VRQQLPPCRDESLGIDAPRFINWLQDAVRCVLEDEWPDQVAVASDNRVRAAETVRLRRV
jgi:hypothetical protein